MKSLNFKKTEKHGLERLPDLCLDKIFQYCNHNQFYSIYNLSHNLRLRIRRSKYFPIYPNQRNAANNVISAFRQGIHYAVVTAETQSGKTGTCQAICYLIRDQKQLGIDNIYFICGMNDNNLKKQQVREFEGLIKEENILFSKDMQFFSSRRNLSKKNPIFFKNTLIFCDESHYAQNINSLVHKFMTKYAGLTMDGDTEKWVGDNLYCVSISATPMSEIVNVLCNNKKSNMIPIPDQEEDTDADSDSDSDPDQEELDQDVLYKGGDILNVKDKCKVLVRLEPGANYYGFRRMLECGRVFKAKNFGDVNDRIDFRNVLYNLWLKQKSENRYKYAIIRFSNSGHGDQYRQTMLGLIDFPVKYIHFHSETMDIKEINKILKTVPEQFTIIEVYHSLRAGIQMNTENICLIHETLTAHTDSTVQGLPGRCTGYNKEKDGVLVYCNKNALEKYVNLVNAEFDPSYTPSNSSNIKIGCTKKADRIFEANVPMGAMLDDDLLERIKTLKNNTAQYSKKFEEEILGELLGIVNFSVNELKDCFVGVTILDNANRTDTVTCTWKKFWDPAFKAYTIGTKGSYFRNIELEPGYKKYYYVYVNVKEEHPEYGWALVTSKSSTSTKKGTYLKTTGKEQFNPKCNDNLLENETTRKIEALKKPTKILLKKPITTESPASNEIKGELLYERIKGPKINLKKQLKINVQYNDNNDNVSDKNIQDHKKWDKWEKLNNADDNQSIKLRIASNIKFKVD